MIKLTNKQFELLGVAEEEYYEWCDKYNKLDFKVKTKQEFIDKIRNGKIVRDHKTGKLIEINELRRK